MCALVTGVQTCALPISQALAAVGHDFRTPLARLRLRADSVADPSVASEMEQDIGEMERMIDSLLAYLSGDIDDPTEPVAPTDIAEIGREACRERVWQNVSSSWGAV